MLEFSRPWQNCVVWSFVDWLGCGTIAKLAFISRSCLEILTATADALFHTFEIKQWWRIVVTVSHFHWREKDISFRDPLKFYELMLHNSNGKLFFLSVDWYTPTVTIKSVESEPCCTPYLIKYITSYYTVTPRVGVIWTGELYFAV